MTERQEYRVIETFADFEIREYEPCVLAEIRVSAHYPDAANTAFSSLFKYISKGNKASQKIAMTAPVISAQRTQVAESNDWFVSFVMPSGSTYGHLPHPNDPRVVLRELAAETCVASSFWGRATVELSEMKIFQLRASAGRENIALSEENRICRFDPPFKPGFMQYNEIVIPIYLGAIT
jgi:hypothetical protein